MRSKLLFTLLACLLSCGVTAAQTPADTTKSAAQDEDFVRVSLITIGPGNEVYSLYGHTAIRMQCPAHKLDYCFTFEMALRPEEELKFLFSTAKAGFIAAKTDLFFNNYRAKGRSITEQQLNLRPTEEQQLWRMLDKEMAKGAHWDYSFLTTNCSSMCIWIIEKSLATEGEKLVYNRLPEATSGTYRDLLYHISRDAPWARLFWNLRMGSKGSEQGAVSDKLAPALLQEAWADAVISDAAGNVRPVFASAPIHIAPQKLKVSPALVTPTMALIIAIIIVITLLIFIKPKFMKKLITSSKRLVLTVTLVLTTALTAMAGGDDWYAYNIQIDTYPTGAGKVYVDENDMMAYAPAEDAVYKESINVQYTSTATMLNIFPQANEGWHLLGFAKDAIDETGNVVRNDSIVSKVDEFAGYASVMPDGVFSKHWDDDAQQEVSDDSLTVAALMPLEPNNYFRAIFTHAYATVAKGYENLATVSADKLINNIGDKVTFTATPLSSFTTFVNWTKDSEVVSTNPTLEVTVGGADEYVANFTDTRNITLTFPEEGGYLPFFSEYSYGLDGTGVFAYSPVIFEEQENDCLVDMVGEDDQRISYLNMIGGEFQTGGMTALLLNGYGEVTLVPNDTVAADMPWNEQVFHWTDMSGLAVGGLNQSESKYYVYDQAGQKFNLITDGSIAPSSLYMVMPDSLMAEGQPAPEVIYVDENVYNTATGIAAVGRGPLASGKRFDLQGRRIDAISRDGIYIFDGKKVIYRKK